MKYYATGNQKEALKALQQVTEAVDEMEAEIVQQAKKIERLRNERDEARREICEYQPRYYGTNSVTVEAHHAAERRGWDCYRENQA